MHACTFYVKCFAVDRKGGREIGRGPWVCPHYATYILSPTPKIKFASFGLRPGESLNSDSLITLVIA